MKRFFIILFIASVCNADIVYERDIYDVTERRYHRSMVDVVVPPGTADGQILFWDTTTSTWLNSDEAKLKWDTITKILLADTFTDGTTSITGGDYADVGNITGSDIDISAGTGDFTTTGGVTANGSTFGDGGNINYIEFSSLGTLTMHGNARVIRHIVIGAASWKLGDTAPTQTYENIFPTISFQDAQTDVVHYTIHVPYQWDDTTDMTVEMHWQHETVNAGKVRWRLKYIGVKEDEDPAGAGTLITQLSAGNHDPDKMIYTTFDTKLLAANLERMDDLGLMLYRSGDHADDTLTEDAELIAMHIHYTMNRLDEPLLAPVTDVLLLDDGASKLLLDDGASFMLIRL